MLKTCCGLSTTKKLGYDDSLVLEPNTAKRATKIEPPIFGHLCEYNGCNDMHELKFLQEISKYYKKIVEVEFLFFM